MSVGDYVTTPKNTLEKVIGVYPQGVVDIYELEFQDGAKVQTCGEHLWQYHKARRGLSSTCVGTTLDIAKHLENGIRPIIPICDAVDLPDQGQQNIDPYVLGVLLGDGCFRSNSPTVTSGDPFIFEKIKSLGYELGEELTKSRKERSSTARAHTLLNLRRTLIDMGLLGKDSYTKFIPEEYIYTSIENRLKLIQGLMDTDGYIDTNGNTYYYTISPQLASSAAFILRSLGFTVTTTTKIGGYKKDGVEIKCQKVYNLYIRGKDRRKLFSLPRKVGRVVDKAFGRRVISVTRVGQDFATCIAISGNDKLFLTSDFIVTHNSHQSLMKVLKYKDDPNFRGIFIRETSVQLSQAGGLYQEAQRMWKQFGAKFKSHPQMTAEFPSGAQVQFKVCAADRDITNFDGGQFSLVVFDEAQNHTAVQVRYLESRIRSQAQGPHQLIATCNPRYQSWLTEFVLPYLDKDTGIPIPELAGKIRYYGEYSGSLVFGDTKEELEQKYSGMIPQTYCFLPATVRDNPIMKKLNPGYVARLENLKRVERERLLLGSWFAKETTAGYFKREWCEVIDRPPKNVMMRMRGMDLASSLPSEAIPNPDWTASVLVSRTTDGFYIVEHAERYRKLTNGVLENIVQTAARDRNTVGDVTVVIPKDPGAAGAAANMFFIRYLSEHGVLAKPDTVNGHSGKLARFQPFASLAEAGLVKVVKGDWNEVWFNELEDFEDGNRNQKDDFFDATSTASKAVMRQMTIPTFSIPEFQQASPIVATLQ